MSLEGCSATQGRRPSCPPRELLLQSRIPETTRKSWPGPSGTSRNTQGRPERVSAKLVNLPQAKKRISDLSTAAPTSQGNHYRGGTSFSPKSAKFHQDHLLEKT
uniref:Uncharacterized protein n=1 Tax=Lhasa Rhabd tick virus 1 TaxID=2972334 RepID=A0A9E8ADA3_9RHAB|nr:MAG: hypothetical protein [Lhasa Rhabd tick virus 1]